MRLSDFVAASQVVVPLRHETVIGAADELMDRLAAAGGISDLEKLRKRVAEEQPEDIVAMGDRAFLLHYRTDAVTALRVALGTSHRPICREIGESETQCARIVLLIVAPRKLAAEYLQLVGAFARLLVEAPDHRADPRATGCSFARIARRHFVSTSSPRNSRCGTS